MGYVPSQVGGVLNVERHDQTASSGSCSSPSSGVRLKARENAQRKMLTKMIETKLCSAKRGHDGYTERYPAAVPMLKTEIFLWDDGIP